MDKQSADRFWSKVKKRGIADCWTFLGYIDKDGYGRFSGTSAHRFCYRLTKGEIPAGLMVRHTCHIRSCVNPEHLLTGTARDNFLDMLNAGRADLKALKAVRKSKKKTTPRNTYSSPGNWKKRQKVGRKQVKRKHERRKAKKQIDREEAVLAKAGLLY